MANKIRNFNYKTAGRGRGVLGFQNLQPCRRPGEKRAAIENVEKKAPACVAPTTEPAATNRAETKSAKTAGITVSTALRFFYDNASRDSAVVVVCNYTANPGCPGGFTELTVKGGGAVVT